MGKKARRIEHFPKMKVRGENGRGRELGWAVQRVAEIFEKHRPVFELTRPTLVFDLDEIRPDWRDTRNGRLLAGTDQTGARS
jgi:hypothetical protein